MTIFKKLGLNAGGWIAAGGSYTTENPNPHNNFPISFNDQASVPQLNQSYLYLEKAVDRGAKDWNFGSRLDLLFGTDSRFTQARGLDYKMLAGDGLGRYDMAIPQAYLEFSLPFAKGLTAKIGHFYTIIGYEVVTAQNNFFYSHAYTMQYGEPFTHTGILFNYPLNENITVNAGTVSGWDNFTTNASDWNFLGNVAWSDDSAANTLSWSVISGNVSSAGIPPSNRTLYSLVFSHSFTGKLRYIFQHDFAYQEHSPITMGNAYWYGLNQYLFYDITGQITAGLRAEWFRDANGTRVNLGSPGDYMEVTLGLNWKPLEWLTFRPELRYDWSDASIKTYDNQTRNRQFMTAVSMVVSF